MQKLLIALAIGGAAFAATAQDKVLKVAIDPTYEPFTYKKADGTPTGFDVDIALAVCAHLKRRCEFVEQVWDSMIPGLQARKYDVIISSMSITADRQKVVDFTDKYYSTPSKVVVRNDIKFDGPASLKGRKIGVLKGSTQEKYANGELKPAGVTVTPYEAQDQVYLDIRSGRLDGTVADVLEVTAGFLSKPEGKDYGVVGPELYTAKYFGDGMGFALRKGREDLKAELNAAIKAIRADGTYKKINDAYFKIDVYGP